jgi:sec-independent protein translocase protein TatC
VNEQEQKTDLPEAEATFVSHLLELRDRLLRIVIVVTLIFAVLFPFANDLYTFLADPLLAHLPAGSSMIAVEVISPFLTPLKMTFFAAIFLGVPYLLYQMWSFVAPGLYQHEKRLATPLLISSVVLFYAGMSFAYFVVFPLVFNFLIGVAPEGVAMMTDINKYLDFVLAMFFAFGLAFEVPVATIILIATGITTADALIEKRPYIIVGAFVIGMFLTPPDVISQFMLALPMWLLFEVGIMMSRVLIQPREDDDETEYRFGNNEAKPAAAAAAATPSNDASAGTESSSAPKGYSAPAYPDSYEPLTEEELESELESASRWEEDVDDDEYNYDDEDEDDDDGDDHDYTVNTEDSDDTEKKT